MTMLDEYDKTWKGKTDILFAGNEDFTEEQMEEYDKCEDKGDKIRLKISARLEAYEEIKDITERIEAISDIVLASRFNHIKEIILEVEKP